MRCANWSDCERGEHHRAGSWRHLTVVCLFAALSLLPLTGCGQPGDEGVPGGSVGTGQGTATMSWDAPTENADGSTIDDLAGFRIYYGTATPLDKATSPSLDVGNRTSYTVTGLTGGTYYFAATAYDALGNESDLSDEVSKVILGTL